MADRSEEILAKLAKAKGAVLKLGKTVKDSDRAVLAKKVDGLIAELQKVRGSENEWKKQRAALEPLEKKLQEMQKNLEPKLNSLNAVRLKFATDAKAVYTSAVPIAQALFQQKTEKDANAAIDLIQEALLSAEGSFSYKLTAAGKPDL